MEKFNAIVIDKNILVRRAIANVLRKEYGANVYTIKDFTNCKKVIEEQNPHIVFLDIEHPNDDALKQLEKLKNLFPQVTFVVLGSLSKEGGEAVLKGLEKGAADFVTKPQNNITRLLCGDHLEKRLPPIIKETAKENFELKTAKSISKDKESDYRNSVSRSTIKLIVIGSSIGGVKALRILFKQFTSNLNVPIVVVQHMPKVYSRVLADELNMISELVVEEADNNIPLNPPKVWIAKGGYHCEVQQLGANFYLNTHRGLRENNVRPSIDVLFRSAARLFGSEVLGVLLSGYGTDGVFGAQAIKKAGGHIFVQEPACAFADTLPKSVIESGLADKSYSIDILGKEIENYISDQQRKAFENLSVSVDM
ncbi:chemotaxis protein CheB [Fodinibius saliphilus]|uniref:chemotaxis protein CheB n=1 Tax=Fodinibius saliphilus TaxID=1920650 RepID=UPI001107E6C9|nr:chemotaxis protein CheB [Fodinibius saliphilus]